MFLHMVYVIKPFPGGLTPRAIDGFRGTVMHIIDGERNFQYVLEYVLAVGVVTLFVVPLGPMNIPSGCRNFIGYKLDTSFWRF